MEPGTVVKALYDFNSGLEGELPLKTGDLVQVVESVDKHWTLGSVRGARGKFPTAFVVEVKLPPVLPGQQLFAATADFSSDVDGDLSFRCGDLIVGVSAVDDNWWRGRLGGRDGIFPLSHAWQLEAPKTSRGPWKADLWARALQDLSAQLDDEMSLARGDLVHVTQILDKDWFWGECNGLSGKFPRNFVALVSDIETPDLSVCPADSSEPAPSESSPASAVPAPPKPQRSFEVDPSTEPTTRVALSEPSELVAGGYHNLNSGLAPYGRTKFPFVAQYPNELSFGVGELVTLVRHVDDEWTEGELGGKAGLFPTEYVDVIVDCASPNAPDASTEDGSTHGGACFGRALFDFAGDTEGDLPLSAGEVVVLLGKVNADWYRARSRDGRLGICPTSFVEELVRSSGEPVTPRKMGRFNSAPSCRAEEVRRRTLPPWGSLAEEAEDARELKSLPSVDRGEEGGEAEAAPPPLRRANTLSSSDSAAFKREVASFHEIKPVVQRAAVPRRPPPAAPSSVSSVPSRTAPPIPLDPWMAPPSQPEAQAQCSGTSQASQGAPVRPEEQAAKEEERRRKRRDHRQCVVTELLQTERDYLKALQMCYDIYFSDQAKAKMRSLDIDAITLFGNLDEVIAVSSQLLGSLERELVNAESCQLVGKCFVSVAEELKEVYGHYCRNHDDVSGLWTK
ncbi:dynamin-binding protein, partial [Ixodes scapularis]